MEIVDANWIRQRLTGQHGELKQLADAVGLDQDKLTKILKGQRRVQSAEVPRFLALFRETIGVHPAHFSEPAQEFFVRDARPSPPGARLAAAIAPDTRHSIMYTVARPFPACGLMVGDLLVIDTDATGADGLVLANAWHPDGSAETLIRRRLGHHLLALDPTDIRPLLTIGPGQELAIIGRVAAVLRQHPFESKGAT